MHVTSLLNYEQQNTRTWNIMRSILTTDHKIWHIQIISTILIRNFDIRLSVQNYRIKFTNIQIDIIIINYVKIVV